jgi:hypothetical protein
MVVTKLTSVPMAGDPRHAALVCIFTKLDAEQATYNHLYSKHYWDQAEYTLQVIKGIRIALNVFAISYGCEYTGPSTDAIENLRALVYGA